MSGKSGDSGMAGNAAKMREALRKVSRVAEEMTRGTITGEPPTRKEVDEWAMRLCDIIDAALYSAPARNCDRFDGDIEKLREACLRERGLNPEENFPEIFGEWLLATIKESEVEG